MNAVIGVIDRGGDGTSLVTEAQPPTCQPLLPLQNNVSARCVHNVHLAQQRSRQVPHEQAVCLLSELRLLLWGLGVGIPVVNMTEVQQARPSARFQASQPGLREQTAA